MIKNRVSFLVSLLILVSWVSAQSATISVMRDGSGDYTRIQPALDAVASGDTLLIGPGEYFEFDQFQWPGYSYDVDVFAFIPVDQLTIIGSGAEETIIGPREFIGSGATYSPKAMVMVGGNKLTLRDLTLQNCYDGLHADGVQINVENCQFLENVYGLVWLVDQGGNVTDCIFDSSVGISRIAARVIGQGTSASFEGCTFLNSMVSAAFQGDLFLDGCNSQGARTGVNLGGNQSSRLFVSNCQINSSRVCITLNQGGPSCTVTDSDLSISTDFDSCVHVTAFSRFTASNSSFSGAGEGVFIITNAYEVSVNGCHILSNNGRAVSASSTFEEGITYDFRNNFWGTEDADEVEQMIFDGVNVPGNYATVLYSPFSDVPVPTERTTLERLKALYR